jgi:general secretion pathway protein K
MKRRANKRGVALILVLGAIATMTVLLTEFQDDATSEIASAIADRDALKAEYLARSGIQLSRLLIAAEPTIRAPLGLLFMGRAPQVPVWDYADKILGAFNDKEGADAFKDLLGADMTETKNLGIEGGSFKVEIVDEDSKINVNLGASGAEPIKLRLAAQLVSLMSGDQYSPMFDQRDPDGQFSDRQTICSAIIDWADFDEDFYPCDLSTTAGTRAAEDAFYQLLKIPYARKNAAYDSLEELRLVRGISDDFWATFVDPDPRKPGKRVMTVWGQGALNVNTANAQSLLAVVCANADRTKTKLCDDPEEIGKFLMGVTLLRGMVPGVPLFTSGSDFIKAMQGQGMVGPLFKMLGLTAVVFKSPTEATKQVTAESKVFSVYADGIVPGHQHKTTVRVHAVVDFRGAPAPGAMPFTQALANAAAPAATAAPSGGASTAAGTAAGGADQGIQNALAPNPAGTIVYYRTE